MAPVVKLVPQPPQPTPVPPLVADLDSFGQELVQQLSGNPQPYRLNAARLNLADRYEVLRRATPKRERSALTEDVEIDD